MRATCYRCFRPKSLCWCPSITAMETRTRFVFLMHPKEFKREKAATGRLTHLCLARSEIHCGTAFDEHAAVQALIADPGNHCMLLYPGREAFNLSAPAPDSTAPAGLPAVSRLHPPGPGAPGGRRLVVFLLDATWALGRKMLRLSPTLQRLPRIMFTPSAPSRYLIKQQPHEGCLSTLEATHELLVALERAGLDHYALPDQLLGLFHRMQDFQLQCAADPERGGYRRGAYRPPAERTPFRGRSATRRARIFQAPAVARIQESPTCSPGSPTSPR
jgi:DTW domain-containing protein